MLIGEYTHALDVKGRVNFPAKLREELGELFYITRSPDAEESDRCLFVYSQAEFETLKEQIRKLPFAEAKIAQRFFSKTTPAEPDKQGRVLIPQNLREYAGLDKEVVVVGAMVRAEIWDKQRWLEQEGDMSYDAIERILGGMNL